MHILLVRFSSMGDVILQTATINWLKSLFGEKVTLTFVTSQEFVSLIDSHPGVSSVIGFNRRQGESWIDLKNKIKKRHEELPITLIMDLHATLRSFRLRQSFFWIPSLTVDKRRWERFLLTKIPFVALKRRFSLETQVERIIRDFDSLFGGKFGPWKVRDTLKNPHGELTTLGGLPEYKIDGKYIVVAPSASFFYKRWQIASFVTLTKMLLEKTSHKIVILAGPEDKFCEAFNEINDSRLLNLQGKTGLKDSMSILSRADLCIGNDSGMNHIAEASGHPVVTIFGPTDPRFGFAPHGEKSVTLSKELWCKPCSTTGKKSCFRDRHYCMEMITPEEVLEQALQILEGR